jgi:hypothetical protein
MRFDFFCSAIIEEKYNYRRAGIEFLQDQILAWHF